MRRGRWLIGAAAVLVVFAVNAAPIAYVETRCRADKPVAQAPPSAFGLPDAGYRRAEGDSFMSFPEWYIVYAYTDLAGVTRQSSESAFDYLASVFGFWNSLCQSTRAAEQSGPVTSDQRVTDYIIGVSFSWEMALIGGWERTIGALTAWARGSTRTAEDEFALKVADDYAAFLQQTPWYLYPFWPQLRRFWAETPFTGSSWLRASERRVALTLTYGGKGLYAKGIAWLAGISPADLRIRSVVQGLADADLAAEPRIQRLRDLGGGATLIETPRYQEFTEILVKLAERGRKILEIAGDAHILTTVVAPEGANIDASGAPLFAIPIQSRPGWRRLGFDVNIARLSDHILGVEKQGARFEHAYDY